MILVAINLKYMENALNVNKKKRGWDKNHLSDEKAGKILRLVKFHRL